MSAINWRALAESQRKSGGSTMTSRVNPMANWSAEDKTLAKELGMLAGNNCLRLEDPKKPIVPLWIMALTDRMFAMYSERLGVPESALRTNGKFGNQRAISSVELVRKHIAVTVYRWTKCERRTANLVACGQWSVVTWTREADAIAAAVAKLGRGSIPQKKEPTVSVSGRRKKGTGSVSWHPVRKQFEARRPQLGRQRGATLGWYDSKSQALQALDSAMGAT